ncbi:hypothetical protein KDW_12110 [Dictyobacter vulcani]|uniref:Acyltransferase 3 domain-containing protein n=1 Tax=Dictyobacter vulcani TaxID=2607529 RepID=A0A5J4KLK3_9CHLR|nr:acyltransferase [Dictyobacter vulcani]GER87049.1 hypothetical protein KDW_12110 [Dictyobacter vulcani]
MRFDGVDGKVGVDHPLEHKHKDSEPVTLSVEHVALPAASKKNNITALDGIRACAIILVMTFHINQMSLGLLWNPEQYPIASALATFGGSGVTLFFILSGFLLFLPYAKSLLFQSNWPSARQFYVKRMLRIIPAYYVALFAIILLFQQEYLQPDHWQKLALFLTFFMDSSSSTFRQLNGPFWTLAIEWQFYMILPLLALGFLLVAKRLPALPRQRLLVMIGCCILLIVWGLFLRILANNTPIVKHPANIVVSVIFFFLYGMTGKYIENFAVGMIICLCYTYAWHPVHGSALRQRLKNTSLFFVPLGLLLLFCMSIWHYNVGHMQVPAFAFLNVLAPQFEWLNEMIIALGYGSCVLGILFGPEWLQGIFSWKPLVWIGLISYGLYMWHLPLISFFHVQLLPHIPITGQASYLLYWLSVLVIVIPVALLSYHLIEKPCTRLGAYLTKQMQARRIALAEERSLRG